MIKILCKCGCGKELTNGGSYLKNHNGKRGKTYDEFFGKDKSDLIKLQQSKNNKKANTGKTWEETYGKEKAQSMRENARKRIKGKTLEEQFGIERAKEIKKTISLNSKGKNSGTYEERFGKERAIIEKQKRSIATKGIKKGTNVNRFGKKKAKLIGEKISLKKIPKSIIIENYKKIYDLLGGMYKNDWNNHGMCNSQTVRNRFGSLDELANQTNRPFKKAQKGKFGKHETFILDKIEEEKGIILDRQKSVKINNNKRYYLDGYDSCNNVVYEVDERYHKFKQEYDMQRENLIKIKLNCKIVRIDERIFLNGINQTKVTDFDGEINA